MRLFYAGDWNEPPGSKGQYTPYNIAQQLDLKIIHAGPGQHGNIDYALTDVKGVQALRLHGGGSDHDAILYRIPVFGVNVLVWNVEVDRDADRVKEMLLWLRETIERYNVDVVMLQEAQQYVSVLKAKFFNWKHFTTRGAGKANQFIMTTKAVKTEDYKLHRMSKNGWRIGKDRHAPLYTPFLTICGRLRIANIHETTGVNWINMKMHSDDPAKKASRVFSARKLIELGTQAHHDW